MKASSLQYLGFFAALSLGGCGNDFDGPALLNKFRFVTVQATPPAIAFGESTQVIPFLVNQRGQLLDQSSPNLSFRWSWCLLRGPNTSGFACLITAEDVEAFTGTEVPPDLFSLGTSFAAELNFDFPPSLFEGDPDDPSDGLCDFIRSSSDISRFVTVPDCDGTYDISIEIEVQNGDAPPLRAYKDLTLIYDETRVPRDQFNLNPITDVEFSFGVRLARAPLDPPNQNRFLPEEVFELLIVGDTDEGDDPLRDLYDLSQTFIKVEEDFDGTLQARETRERLRLSWFVSRGGVDDARTGFLPNDTESSNGVPDPGLETQEWVRARSNLIEVPALNDLPNRGQTEEDRELSYFVVIADERGGISVLTATTSVFAP